MDKSFEPAAFETRWYKHWEDSGCFKPSGIGTPYTILLPPPNVTGTLHMGHAFQHTLMDALVRYHRMRGFDTLWQVGTDHAGIATEMVVNRNLALAGNGETRDGLGRDAFIERVWEWKKESGDTIARQMRRIGASGDWSRETFTMDPMPSASVVEAFVRLHDEGLIYRGQRLVNWDPVLKTAISDLEVVSEEEQGAMWSIRYPLADGATYDHVEHDADGNETLRESRDYLVVATTRPETMLGDVAVAVHPDDARYAHLIGKQLRLPLSNRLIPIIADDYVDRDFGTGCVKITPAHDFNDYAIGQRHALPMINIFTPDAKINDNAPQKYRGEDRYAARKLVLADLVALDLLVEEKKHKLQVPRGDRTGQVIEPYLTDQWFVKMDALAKRGLELVENGSVQFVPPNWISTYRHWMENIQDWCISRQLWWGHRIPAWYDDAGNAYVGSDEADVRAKKNLGPDVSLRQDSDVLETWFSSALWPFSTMGWPNEETMKERGCDRYLPSSVLVTGFDIIFFWVARMIMMTDHFTGRVPFEHVYITGLVRDRDGQKMSKSKGNVLDPLDIIDGISADALVTKRTTGLMKPTDAPRIEKATRKEFPEGIAAYGADALRFTFASLATHGRDIKFDLQRCEGYKNFCNKLWNAANYVLRSLPEVPSPEQAEARGDLISPTQIVSKPENWPATAFEKALLTKLSAMLRETENQYSAYRFDLVSQAQYDFVWTEFCDWAIELSKPYLNAKVAVDLAGDGELFTDVEKSSSVQYTLLYVLEASLRALHPLIPFITEEIWHAVAPRLGIEGDSISRQPYPRFDETQLYPSEASDVEWLRAAVIKLRSIRSQLSIAPLKTVPLLLQGKLDDPAQIERHAASLKFLARLESIDWLAGDAPPAAGAVLGELKLLIPLAGLVDLDAERTRLAKELKRVEGELAKSQGKLASDTFVQNAPAAVVEQERQRLIEWTQQIEGLRAQQDALSRG
ncbi:valine--tRNA ligase [Chiayiivirga flava]|uniref:Valine--tRNA ligase n=1 Tax=Chiayiivirga flava TaxID=659595 RepID=A0A7W8D6Y4_9GAMM|nr:valine--tRNA ligase [Chiayiivirga flava]MBB5208677.1 valyl-tRNA synthetase [Chiayiivirga flava]